MAKVFEQKIPDYVAGYLGTVLSIPVVSGSAQQEKDRPFVSVFCEEFEKVHKRCWAGDIVIQFHSLSENDINEDNVVVQEIRDALDNNNAFDEYMFSLPDEERTGWSMQKFKVTGGSSTFMESELIRDSETVLRVAVVC